MRVPSGVVYGAFGVTLLVAIVVLMRMMTALRRQFLAGFLVDRGQSAADSQRASFDSVDSALVLDVQERGAGSAATGVSSPPRVSLPEGEAAAAAKRPPLPVSRAELDRLCPPITLPQAKIGEEETPACAVCLEAMADGDIVRQMPACAHLFHDAYVFQWTGAVQARCGLFCFPVCWWLGRDGYPVACMLTLIVCSLVPFFSCSSFFWFYWSWAADVLPCGHPAKTGVPCATRPSRRSTKSLLWPHLSSTNSGGSSRRGHWSTKPRLVDCMMARHRQLCRA